MVIKIRDSPQIFGLVLDYSSYSLFIYTWFGKTNSPDDTVEAPQRGVLFNISFTLLASTSSRATTSTKGTATHILTHLALRPLAARSRRP